MSKIPSQVIDRIQAVGQVVGEARDVLERFLSAPTPEAFQATADRWGRIVLKAMVARARQGARDSGLTFAELVAGSDGPRTAKAAETLKHLEAIAGGQDGGDLYGLLPAGVEDVRRHVPKAGDVGGVLWNVFGFQGEPGERSAGPGKATTAAEYRALGGEPDACKHRIRELRKAETAIGDWLADHGREAHGSRPADGEADDDGPREFDQETIAALMRKATGAKVKGRGIDGKMWELVQRRPEARGWSAREWADALECSPSTVHGTGMWRSLATVRAATKAEQVVSRAGRR